MKIIDILKINPYCAFFWFFKDMPDLEHQQIHIRSNVSLDQRFYNTPSTSQVAAIWVDENTSKQHMSQDIIVYSHRVQYYFGCYDPLQHSLLVPYGDTGWHQIIQRLEKGKQNSSSHIEELINLQASNPAIELLKNETQGIHYLKCQQLTSNLDNQIVLIENLLIFIFSVLEKRKSRATVSCCEYYCYKLQI